MYFASKPKVLPYLIVGLVFGLLCLTAVVGFYPYSESSKVLKYVGMVLFLIASLLYLNVARKNFLFRKRVNLFAACYEKVIACVEHLLTGNKASIAYIVDDKNISIARNKSILAETFTIAVLTISYTTDAATLKRIQLTSAVTYWINPKDMFPLKSVRSEYVHVSTKDSYIVPAALMGPQYMYESDNTSLVTTDELRALTDLLKPATSLVF